MLCLERARQLHAAKLATVAAQLPAQPPRRDNGHAADVFALTAGRSRSEHVSRHRQRQQRRNRPPTCVVPKPDLERMPINLVAQKEANVENRKAPALVRSVKEVERNYLPEEPREQPEPEVLRPQGQVMTDPEPDQQ